MTLTLAENEPQAPDEEIAPILRTESSVGLLSDEPISAPNQDRLGFDLFAGTLADFFTSSETRTPLTVGIYGKWGSGKTSLMRLIHNQLQQSPSTGTECLWFNAWEHYNEGGVIIPLLRALGERVEDGKSDGTTAANEGGSRGIAIALAEKLTQEAREQRFKCPVLDRPEAPAPLHSTRLLRQVCDYEPIRDCFSDLVRSVVGNEGRLVVFIDDLDRCLPDRVVAVLEDVKLILHVPRCVFVLGADRDLIHRSVRIVYQSLNIPDAVFGETERDYLEKIVQVEFILPPVSRENLHRYVESLDGSDTLRACAHVVLDGIGDNPRQIKRFVNEYRLLATLASRSGLINHGRPQINLELLAKWLTLTRRWPELAKDLHRHPSLLSYLEAAATTLEEAQRDTLLRRSSLAARYVDDDQLLSLLELPPFFGETDLRSYIHLTQSTDGERVIPAQQASLARNQELLAELFCEDAVRRETALGKVAAMSPPRRRGLLDPAVERLGKGEMQSRCAAADLLGALGGDEAVETLQTTLNQTATPSDESDSPNNEALSLRWILLRALAKCGGDWVRTILADHNLVYVPAGEFVYGEKVANLEEGYDPEMVNLGGYYMERLPVTNADYALFVRASGHRPPRLWQSFPDNAKGLRPPQGKENHPVVGLTWDDAKAYARWTRRRLPTEQEWEKAARGADGRLFPWGNSFDPKLCNTKESYRGDTTAVDHFPGGASPYGSLDMIGNVWEFTASAFGDDPRDQAGNPDEFSRYPILRGGSYESDQRMARCSGRIEHSPVYRISLVGFRCCLS